MDIALMQDADIFMKSDSGRDEIKSRTRGLAMPVRAILLMVDGQRSVAQLRSIIAGSKAPSDTLDALLAHGLIEARAGGASPPGAGSAPPVPPGVVQNPHAPQVATDVLDLVLPTIYEELPPEPASTGGTTGASSKTGATGATGATATDTTGAPRANRYEQLYGMMNEVVRDFLPAHRRYFIQLKIERASTADDLLELLHDLRASLAKARGDAFANDVVARLKSATA